MREPIDASNQEVMSVSTISDEVTNAVNQLPESDQAGLPGIKELLTQLQRVIETDDSLKLKDRAEALKQIQTLAETGKNPQSGEARSQAEAAIGVLRGMSTDKPQVNYLYHLTGKTPVTVAST